MNFKKIKPLHKISRFEINEGNLVFLSENKAYLNDKLILDNDYYNSISFVTKSTIYYGNLNESFYHNIYSNTTIKLDEKWTFYWNTFQHQNVLICKNRRVDNFGNTIADYHIYDFAKDLLKSRLFEGTLISIIQNWGISILVNKISFISLETGYYQWQTDLSRRKYLDIWHEEKEVKIQRIIGLYENQLLVAFSNEELISIDTQTGKILWETKDFIKTNLPDSRNISQFRFVYWHIENGKMYQLDGNVYYSIDLNTQAVEILWTDKSVENYLTIAHKTYTEEYVYFTGSYNQRLQPHLVGVFNRKTFSVDWIHDVDLTTDQKMGYPPSLNQAPQVDGNKLYILDTGGTLHIFEKTEDN